MAETLVPGLVAVALESDVLIGGLGLLHKKAGSRSLKRFALLDRTEEWVLGKARGTEPIWSLRSMRASYELSKYISDCP